MIQVSEAWERAHTQTLLPETFVEITLNLMDVELEETASVSGKYEAEFSNADSIVNRISKVKASDYALLEHNMWALDGSQSIVAELEDYKANGYVSKNNALSDAYALLDYNTWLLDGSRVLLGDDFVKSEFYNGVTIRLSAVREKEIPGLSITWSTEFGEYATDFTAEFRRGDTIIASATINGNTSLTTDVPLEVSNYDSLTVKVLGWSMPEHRVRIESVVFGYVVRFDKDQIISYSHEQSCDLVSGEIPKNSIEFSVDNVDGKWNMLNPEGFERFLYDRQPVSVRYGMTLNGVTEWVDVGTFFLSQWTASANGLDAKFVARDAFEFMLNAHYDFPGVEATHTGSSTINIYEGPGATYDVVGTLSPGEKVTVYEQSDYLNESIWYRIDRGWVNHATIRIDSSYTMESLLLNAMETTGLLKKINTELAPVLAERTPPVTVKVNNVAELVQMIANACCCTMWQNRAGLFSVKRPDYTSSEYTIPLFCAYSYPEVKLVKPLKAIDIIGFLGDTRTYEFDNSGEDIRIDNPLIYGDATFEAMRRWFENSWKFRENINGEFRADPRLDVYDVVAVETRYGVIEPVMLTYLKYTYNGSFHGYYEGRRIGDEAIS